MVGWHHRLNRHEFEQTQKIVEDRGAWCAAVHRVAKSRTQWRDRTTKQKPNLIMFELFIREGEELVINKHLAEMWWVARGVMLLLEVLGENPSFPLPTSGGPQHPMAFNYIPPGSASTSKQPSSLHTCVYWPLLTETPASGFRADLKSKMISSQDERN